MTPTQAESIARERLPCKCKGYAQTNSGHEDWCPSYYRPAVARALVEAAGSAWCFDMSKAPKNGQLLQLILEHADEPSGCDGGFENEEYTRVMGFNNGDDDGEDIWKFPGWDWCQDCIIEQGCGKPIAWALMLEAPVDIAAILSSNKTRVEGEG